MNKRLLNLGVGLVVGALGGKVLASQTVKKIAVNTVAGGLKIKEEIDKTVENVKVSTEDIIAEAKVKKAEDEKKEAEKKAALDIEEVAEEAKRKSEEAHKKFFQEIREYIRKQRAKWGKEYNVSFSNE